MGNGLEYASHFAGSQIEVVSSQVNGLSRELRHVRSNWRQERLPENWRYLDGTGFQTEPHIDMLYNSFSEFDQYTDRQKKITTWLQQTREDIKGFNLEYLAEGLTFPLYYKPDYALGKIICPLYGDKEMEDIVSEEERNGSVKRAIADKVKPFLLNSRDGSIAVMTSPAGWSGLRMQNGKPIVFPDSQTYIWQKKGEEIAGFTIRTDFSLEEHREVIKRLSGRELPESAGVCDFVENVSFLRGEEDPSVDIADIVNTMRYVRQDLSQGMKINAYKNRHWNEIYTDLQNSKALWRFDEKGEEYFGDLKEFVERGDWSRRDLQEALAVTILRIAKNLRKGGVSKTSISLDARYDPFEERISWGAVLEEVEEKAGCAGGGGNGTVLEQILNSTKKLIQSVSPRFGVDEEEGFTCPKCGFEAIGPIGNTCPGCKITKEEYAKELGGVVCD